MQELLTLPVLSGVRVSPSLVFCVVFCGLLLPFCAFSFGQCTVFLSPIYGLLLTFGIFKLFFLNSFNFDVFNVSLDMKPY